VIESPWAIKSQYDNVDYNNEDCIGASPSPPLFVFGRAIVSSFAITTFAYTCHTNIFPIRVELVRPLELRMRKIFNRAVGLEWIMYMCMGIFGYLSMMDNPQELITERKAPSEFGSLDLAMLIGTMAMTLNLVIALPVNINPCRIQILNVMKIDPYGEFNKTRHIAITGICLFSSAALALVYPQVAAAFGILGGTCSTLLGITFPIAIYLHLSKDPMSHPLNIIMLIVAVVFTCAGFSGAVIVLGFQPTPSSAC